MNHTARFITSLLWLVLSQYTIAQDYPLHSPVPADGDDIRPHRRMEQRRRVRIGAERVGFGRKAGAGVGSTIGSPAPVRRLFSTGSISFR